MRKLNQISLGFLVLAWFSNPGWAQITNVLPPIPATKLEAFDTNTEVVILKGSTDLGAISAEAGEIGVRCREITDTSTGHKEQGLALEIVPRGQNRSVLQIDYDEISRLVNAIEYITKLEVTVTPLNSFDAAYTTKGGFRIAALGTRRTGTIQFGVRDARTGGTPVVFSRDDMSRLSALINQGKDTLDSLRR
ncbi:MAG TPA: hypothetical protein VFE51_09570 [Verrucomicrobiae bacterium]|nr:hypothetical protein [Verrucomicrobiae bacterium]